MASEVRPPLKDKDKFLRAYSNMPLGVRSEIILVIDNRPITWNVAFIEIDNDTKMGERILNKLIDLGLI